LERDINSAIAFTQTNYDKMLYKDACKHAFSELQEARETYITRLTDRKLNLCLIKRFIEVQVILLASICPHICDYIYQFLHPKTSIMNAKWPSLGKNIFSRKKKTIMFRIFFNVEQELIDNEDLNTEEANISFTTIGSNSLSTCHFFLIVGTINQKNFCYLSHSSQSYDEAFTPEQTAANIINNIKCNITILHIQRPNEHPRQINISNMKNIKLFVGGGDVDKKSQNLIEESVKLINDEKYNKKLQNLATQVVQNGPYTVVNG
jgi:leucyl-tRNA synthetase